MKVFCLFLFLSFSIQAQQLSFSFGQEQLQQTPLLVSANFSQDKIKAQFQPVGKAIQIRKLFSLIPTKAYLAEFLAVNPLPLKNTISSENAPLLNAFKLAGPLILKLTCLRDAPAEHLLYSFEETLSVNHISEAEYTEELKALFDDLKKIKKWHKNQVLSFIFVFENDQLILYVQKPDLTFFKVQGSETFAQQVFKIWFAKPSDPKLVDLRKELLN